MFNPIFTGNVQGRNHPGRCAFVEPELLCFRSLNVLFKIKIMAIKIPIIFTTITMKYNSIKELVRGTHNDTQHQNTAHPKNSPKDCDGVQLASAQCHTVPIFISWYRESRTIQFKYTFETRQEIIRKIASNTTPWPHQLLVCICLSDLNPIT